MGKIIFIQDYLRKKEEEKIIRIGDVIEWYDPVYEEYFANRVTSINLNPGQYEYPATKVVAEEQRFNLILDEYQCIDGSLFIRKIC